MGSTYSFAIDIDAKTQLDTLGHDTLELLLDKFSGIFVQKECFNTPIEYFPAIMDELLNDRQLLVEESLGGSVEKHVDLTTRGHLVARVMNMWLARRLLVFTPQGRLQFDVKPMKKMAVSSQ